MSDKCDKELEELFPEEPTNVDLKRVVKKIRCFTILRNIAIAVVVSVVVFVGAFLLNIQLLNISRNKLTYSFFFEKVN